MNRKFSSFLLILVLLFSSCVEAQNLTTASDEDIQIKDDYEEVSTNTLRALDYVGENVPELSAFAHHIDIYSNGQANLTSYVPNPRPEGDYYTVYVGESWADHQVNWEWFLVKKDFTEIFRKDILDDDLLTLDEWRVSEKYIEKMKSLENDALIWAAYETILLGDFSQIEDETDRQQLESLYKLHSESGEFTWKYILMDFNRDYIRELYIRLSPEFDSALLAYDLGKIKCIYLDADEATSYLQPMYSGSLLLSTYDSQTSQSKTILELDKELNLVAEENYYSINYDEASEEVADAISEKYPMITAIGNYYYYQEFDNNQLGESTILSKEEWQQAMEMIDRRLVPDEIWRDCANLDPICN